jgi:hypothetical protein
MYVAAQLEIECARSGVLRLEIVSLLGAVLERRDIIVSGGRVQQVPLATARLAPGAYQCRIVVDGRVHTRAFVVLR